MQEVPNLGPRFTDLRLWMGTKGERMRLMIRGINIPGLTWGKGEKIEKAVSNVLKIQCPWL